jgi:uncharacterized protein YbaR (Trm112 family)
MDGKLLEILVCPSCHGSLQWAPGRQMLLCPAERLGYPVIDGIAHLLEEEAIAVPEIGVANVNSDA